MKRSIPLPVALMFFGSTCAFAQDERRVPALYGRVNLTPLINTPAEKRTVAKVVSNASRLGLRGELPVAGSIKVIYQAEYQFNPNKEDFDGRFITQRNSWIGLSGALGTLLAGRNDTPLRQLQARIDQFNDLQGDLRVLMVGENRPNDTINYVSPTFGGFTFRHAAVFDGQNTLLDRFTKATSTSLSYTAGRFYVGVALDRDVISLEDDRNDDVRLAGQYNEGNLQLGILYESSVNRANNRGREDGLLISASLTRGRLVYKAQTGTSEQRYDGHRQTSLGVDYVLNPDFRWFTFFTATRADNRNQRSDQLGVGMDIRF